MPEYTEKQLLEISKAESAIEEAWLTLYKYRDLKQFNSIVNSLLKVDKQLIIFLHNNTK